jgi:hypothetical protein
MMLPTGDLLDPEGDQWLSRRWHEREWGVLSSNG